MATIERIRTLAHLYTRSHSRPEATLPGKSVAFSTIIHHQSTKAGVGFYASRRPEPG
jgi:hypothetical protein